MRRYELRDDQFARIEHLLPGRPGSVGRNSDLGNRAFVNAVIWRFRAGTPWRDIPERFGDGRNIHRRFSRWAKSGVWEKVFNVLADDPDNEYASIDATIVRAHQHSAGALKGRPGHRAIAPRTDDENSRHRRRPRQSARRQPDRGTSSRHHAGRGARRQGRSESHPRGQGLRLRRLRRKPRGAWRRSGDPAEGEQKDQTRMRFRPLPRAQSRRTVLL